MKERMISMTNEMLLATRDRKKNATRRFQELYHVNTDGPDDWSFCGLVGTDHLERAVAKFQRGAEVKLIACPYGIVGTVMWVKEAYKKERAFPNAQPHSPNYDKMQAMYKADKAPAVVKAIRWSAAHTMPRIFARYFIKITSLECERIQSITDVGAIDEGVLTLSDEWIAANFPKYHQDHIEWVACNGESKPPIGPSPRQRFHKIITSLNGDDGWNENWWAWVIKFELLNNYSK
jgi:hypothetical protein